MAKANKLAILTLGLTRLKEIDELQNHGINASDITKLKQAGICTVRVTSLNFAFSMHGLKCIVSSYSLVLLGIIRLHVL